MAKLSIRNRQELSNVVKSGSNVSIFRNPKTQKVVVSIDGSYAGIDSRLEPLIEAYVGGDESALDKLVSTSFLCEAQEIDANGNPAVIGIDPQTGAAKTADWIPCLLMESEANTLVSANALREAVKRLG